MKLKHLFSPINTAKWVIRASMKSPIILLSEGGGHSCHTCIEEGKLTLIKLFIFLSHQITIAKRDIFSVKVTHSGTGNDKRTGEKRNKSLVTNMQDRDEVG